MPMLPEDRLLLLFTRQQFLPEHEERVYLICDAHPIRWNLVLGTAQKHGVTPLVNVNLSTLDADRLGMRPSVAEAFRQYTYRAALVRRRRRQSLVEVVRALDEAGVDVLLIKGAALDVTVYTQPWYTVSDDVDLVLRTRSAQHGVDVGQIAELFRGLPFEWEWNEHHDVTLNGVLPIDFARLWQRAHRIDLDGHPAFVLAPEHLLLAVCLNSCRKRFFRLKHLCDIAETVAAFPDLDWDDVIRDAHSFECRAIVYAALYVTRVTVGCEVPAAVLDRLSGHPVRAALIRRLIQHLLTRPLDSLYVFPDSDGDVRHRQISASLLLPYASYRWYQALHKLYEAYVDWRSVH